MFLLARYRLKTCGRVLYVVWGKTEKSLRICKGVGRIKVFSSTWASTYVQSNKARDAGFLLNMFLLSHVAAPPPC